MAFDNPLRSVHAGPVGGTLRLSCANCGARCKISGARSRTPLHCPRCHALLSQPVTQLDDTAEATWQEILARTENDARSPEVPARPRPTTWPTQRRDLILLGIAAGLAAVFVSGLVAVAALGRARPEPQPVAKAKEPAASTSHPANRTDQDAVRPKPSRDAAGLAKPAIAPERVPRAVDDGPAPPVVPNDAAPDVPSVPPSIEPQPLEPMEKSGPLPKADPRAVLPAKAPGPGGVAPALKPAEGPLSEVAFMGTSAKGRRFCIIADCSGSMNRIAAANPALLTPGQRQAASLIGRLQRELRQTVTGLEPGGQFYVLLFADRVEEMPGRKWLNGGRDAEAVLPWIASIRAAGGTYPQPAFDRAFKLDPPPDVIFFMTDGAIPTSTVDAVLRLNRGPKKVVIHTLQLVLPPNLAAAPFNRVGPQRPGMPGLGNLALEELLGTQQLRRMAFDSGGTFRVVSALDGR